jgi:hypothetical protein
MMVSLTGMILFCAKRKALSQTEFCADKLVDKTISLFSRLFFGKVGVPIQAE